MKSALVATGVVVAMSISASSAFADGERGYNGYVGLGLGAEPAVNDDLANNVVPEGRSLRLLGGLRFGNIAFEGALNGFGVAVHGFGDHTIYQLSAAVKLSLPLGNGFEAFGRIGLEHTWLTIEDTVDRSFSGNGLMGGAGFEYRFPAGSTKMSVFVDYTLHHATLSNVQDDLSETSRIWALGVTVGF
jgi:opacity protein-like surface antigen